MIRQTVMHRAIDLAAREHAENPAVLHHGEALEAVAAHPLGRSGDGIGRRQGLRRAVGHDLADGDGGVDVVLQQVDQGLEHRRKRAIADQRSSRAAVAAAAQALGDLADVDRVVGAAGHHLDVAAHLH